MVSEIVVNEFVAEAREHLGNTECDLLAMENCAEGESCGVIDRIFRSIHSIKGGSGTFGFPAVMELSHAMESVLLLFRKGVAEPDHEKINILLQGVDKLKSMIDDIHSSSKIDCRSELERLNAILPACGKSGGGPSQKELKACSPPPGGSIKLSIKGADHTLVTFLPEAGQISSALSMQHFLFAIRADEDFLDKLLEFGLCLAASVENRADGSCHYLFSTILEPDLVATALSISNEQIQRIDPETLRLALIAPPLPETAAEPEAKKQKEKTPETIRVNVELLDILINLAGELVLGRNQLRQVLEATVDTNPRLRSVIQNVNLVTSEMQAHILQMRMQPIRNIFSRMHRLVRDLCDQLSKEVELLTEGGQVELDKSILEGLIDPVVHIIRNCVDHGIETGEQRSAQGKRRKGQIRLLASHEGGQVSITITDDGRGMEPEAIVEKAVIQGLLSPEGAGRMSEKDKLALIFLPGFSTAKTVTNVSGRGVGMDVVKTNVERFGGHVEIESVKGCGTTIRIRIPLTLAIISSLIVGTADQRFAIPQENVKELVCIPAEDKRRRIEKVGVAPVLRLREQLLPLVRLTEAAGLSPTFVHPVTEKRLPERRKNIADRRENPQRRDREEDRRRSPQSDIYVVVLKVVGNLFGLIVDELFNIEEIVVKPLSDHIRDCRCFAGSTIMGDGRVAMILDAAGIASSAKLRFAEVQNEQLRRLACQSKKQDSAVSGVSTLIFKCAPDEQLALALSSITRLEKISANGIVRIGNRDFINYRGKVLPLMRLDTFLPVSPIQRNNEELHVIIPKLPGIDLGILISEVVDVVELSSKPGKSSDNPPGIEGSAVIDGKITMFLDMEELLRIFNKEGGLN